MWKLGGARLCLAFSVLASGQVARCTPEQSRRADAAVDTLSSWDRLHDWYVKYRQCDDGGPAEGVSEAVARNLVDRWKTLPRLAELTKDIAFKRFVLKHLDETLRGDDLKKISENATKHCPANLDSLCRELRTQADAP